MSDLRVIWYHLRLSLMTELAYRANLVMQVIEIAIRLALSLVTLSVVFAYTERLGGWLPAELLAMVGVYFIAEGLINMVIQPNMELLMEAIRTGTLDFVLTKPVDAQVLVSGQTFQVWKLVDITAGALLLMGALMRLGASLSAGRALLFGVTLLAGMAVMYSLLLMLSTLTFWLIRIDNMLVIFQSLYEAGRWPVSIYPPWLRLALTLLVPVAFAVTVPAEAIIGRLGWGTGGLSLLLAGALLMLSRWLWRRGLRRYAGASS